MKNEIAEIGISKDASNSHLKYKYATLSNILNKVNEVAKNNKVLFTIQIRLNPEMTSITNKLFYDGIVTLIDTENDETLEFTYSFPSDTAQKNNDIQAFGSTMTYSQRYMLGALFGIAFDDEDPDHDKNTVHVPKQSTNNVTNNVTSNDLISDAQNKMLFAKVKEYKISKEKAIEILSKFGYQNSKEIKKKDFNNILESLKNV